MLQISLVPLQRPAMRSCYVIWSRERLVVGRIRKKLIGSEGPTQRHVASQISGARSDKSQTSGKNTPCVHYNKGSCVQKATHETKGVLYRHICASCWSKDGKQFAHPQSECRKSQGQSKNE